MSDDDCDSSPCSRWRSLRRKLLLKYGDITVSRLIDTVHLMVDKQPRKALRKSLNKYHGDVCDIFGMDASTLLDDDSDEDMKEPQHSPHRRGGNFLHPLSHLAEAPSSIDDPSPPSEPPAPADSADPRHRSEVTDP